MDKLDRQIINSLQGNFPIVDNPYEQVAEQLGIDEDELLKRLKSLLENASGDVS